jgi:formiminotetrahydrofolate cyclodeaminase
VQALRGRRGPRYGIGVAGTDELLALPLAGLLEALASEAPAPAGGALAAIAAAGAAAMVEMAASLTLRHERYRAAWPKMEATRERAAALRRTLVEQVPADAAAYGAVLEALRLPQADETDRQVRAAALDRALLAAAVPPGRIVAAAAEVADLAAAVAERGNVNVVGDAMTAAVVGEAAGRAGAMLVEMDAGASRDPGSGAALVAARAASVRAAAARTRALAAAEMRRPRP